MTLLFASNFYRLFLTVLISAIAFFMSSKVFSQTSVRLNTFSSNELMVKRLNCPAGSVQFARGVRWAPADNKVSLTINDRDEIILPAGCYGEMLCGNYKGASSVVLVHAPACGGNAVGEEYIVIDLISKQRRTLNYSQFKSSFR